MKYDLMPYLSTLMNLSLFYGWQAFIAIGFNVDTQHSPEMHFDLNEVWGIIILVGFCSFTSIQI